MRQATSAPDAVAASQQATTTTFDVVESQAILKQLTGNTGGIYRKLREPAHVRWLRAIRAWFRRDASPTRM